MSIEKKLTYLKNTKALIRKKLNRFGINVSSENTFRSYVDFLDEILNRYPKSRGQGTSITLENTIEATFTIFDVEGNSEQESTKGYQLLPKATKLNENTRDISTVGGITYANLGGGHFHISGTATEMSSCAIFRDTAEPLIVPAGSYTISSNNLPDGVKVITSGGGNNGFVYTELSSSNPKVTSSVTDDTKPFNYIVIRVSSGTTVNTDIYFMLESGTTAHEWEPYTNGASPNPNYEQPILSSGDNENLFDITTAINGYINTNGAVSANDDWKLSQYIEVKNNSSYTMSRSDGTRQSFVIAEYDENKTFIKRNEQGLQPVGVNSPYTITTGATTKYIRINYNNAFQATTIKLEKGNKASGYSPYGMGSINEKISNKNLVKSINVDSRTSQYITTLFIDCDLKANTTYTISFIGTSGNKLYANEKIFNSSGNFTVTSGRTSVTLTTKANLPQDQYSDGKGWNIFKNQIVQTAANIFNDIQLEKGSTATSFVEHKEQDYSIFVQQPRRSIGDVRDLFLKNTVDSPYYDENLTLNSWYERHIVYRYKLIKGTITDFNTTYNRLTLLFTGVNVNSGAIAGLSNVAKVLTNVSVNTTYTNSIVLRQRDNGGVYIYCWLDGITSRELAENFLDNNDVYVDFPIATPTYLPCTETQIQQLENLPSTYKDFTIIQSEDETQAYLEVAGLKED